MDSYSFVLHIDKLVSILGHEPPSTPRVELWPSWISYGDMDCHAHLCITLTAIDPDIGALILLNWQNRGINLYVGILLPLPIPMVEYWFSSTNSVLGHWSPHGTLITTTESSLEYWSLHWNVNSLSYPIPNGDIDPTLGMLVYSFLAVSWHCPSPNIEWRHWF